MDEHGAPLFYQTFLNNTWDQPKPITLQGIESLVVNAVEREKLRLAPGDAATAKFGRIKVTKVNFLAMGELDYALRNMINRRPADNDGIVGACRNKQAWK